MGKPDKKAPFIGKAKVTIARNERKCSEVKFCPYEGFYVHEHRTSMSDICLGAVQNIEIIGNIIDNSELVEVKN